MMHALALLQGVVEYGGLTGQAAGARGFRGWPISAWVSEHRVAVLVGLAVLLALALLRGASRRA